MENNSSHSNQSNNPNHGQQPQHSNVEGNGGRVGGLTRAAPSTASGGSSNSSTVGGLALATNNGAGGNSLSLQSNNSQSLSNSLPNNSNHNHNSNSRSNYVDDGLHSYGHQSGNAAALAALQYHHQQQQQAAQLQAAHQQQLSNAAAANGMQHQMHTTIHQIMPEDLEDSCDDEPKAEKRAGRRKIKIEYIEDKSRRHITFSKRKAGIMKKAYELSTLTGTQVLLLVASETGHVYTFATPKLQPLITKHEGKNLIQACLNAPEPGMELGLVGIGNGYSDGNNSAASIHSSALASHHHLHHHDTDYSSHSLQHDSHLSAALKLSAVSPSSSSPSHPPYSNPSNGNPGQYPTTSLPLNLLPNPGHQYHHQPPYMAAYPYWQKPNPNDPNEHNQHYDHHEDKE